MKSLWKELFSKLKHGKEFFTDRQQRRRNLTTLIYTTKEFSEVQPLDATELVDAHFAEERLDTLAVIAIGESLCLDQRIKVVRSDRPPALLLLLALLLVLLQDAARAHAPSSASASTRGSLSGTGTDMSPSAGQ